MGNYNNEIDDNIPDADIAAGVENLNSPALQKHVQAMDFIPVAVDLTQGNTLGRMLLDAIKADAQLHAEFRNNGDRKILEQITAIAFQAPTADVTVAAYDGATTHVATIPSGQTTYFPAPRLWRRYVAGPADAVLHVLVG